jgi:pre-mRNA-splicing factor 38A
LPTPTKDGNYEITYMDEFIDELLVSDRVCDTILPRLPKRHVLEENGDLEPRVSILEKELVSDAEMEDLGEDEFEEDEEEFEEDESDDEEEVEDQDREAKREEKVSTRVTPVLPPMDKDIPDVLEKKKKKAWSKKKVNSLFKKSKSKSSSASADKEDASRPKGGGASEELSIEETNRIRVSLGLKPLKQ